MAIIKLIHGKEIESILPYKGKTFEIGSKLQWGNKVWVVVKSSVECRSCYFCSNGRCYRTGVWVEELGECSTLPRVDSENVIFQLKNLNDDIHT